MRFNSTTFQIDPTPRHADGAYRANARISCRLADGEESAVHSSGDLAAFDAREDAVVFAKEWAIAWLDARYG